VASRLIAYSLQCSAHLQSFALSEATLQLAAAALCDVGVGHMSPAPSAVCSLMPKLHLAHHVSRRHDSTCRAHAFWLCWACRTAQLDTLDTTNLTRSAWRARQAQLAP